LTPEENRIIELINEIVMAREALRKRGLPEFIAGECAEAQAYAEKALKSFRASEISRTKALFWAANAYYDRAKSHADEVGTLNEKIAGMLGATQKQPRRRK
jgi:hypothetical protein